MADEKILLSGGVVIDPARGRMRKLDVLVEDGTVIELGRKLRASGAQLIDCRRKHIAPGFIDMHCHLREPGREDAETIATGTRSALAGGFMRVCPMPNTEPPTDSEAMVRFQLRRAEEAGFAQVHPVGCCTKGRQGRELAEIGSMRQAGAVAVSDDGNWIADPEVMRRVLEYAKAFDLPVVVHCELSGLGQGGTNEGLVSTRLGLRSQPDVAEAAAAARDIMLAELAGSRIHVAHVSGAKTVEVVRWAKARRVQVTAETCPHYFTLTEDALEGFDANYKVNPPLRAEADRIAVVEGLADGTIDVIATDHAPHTKADKEVEFESAPAGMIGFETAFSLGYEQLVLSGKLDFADYIARLTVAPASILGLPMPRIEPGLRAELVILDLAAKWTYTSDQVVSHSHNSPFLGRQMQGLVVGGILGPEQFWLLHPA